MGEEKASEQAKGKLLGERLSLLPGLVHTVVSVFVSAVQLLIVAQSRRGMEREHSAGDTLQADVEGGVVVWRRLSVGRGG